jgi:hypothetical protein
VIRALAASAIVFLATSASAEELAPSPECPPRAALEAAKSALAAGDREGALREMRRAKEILAACEGRARDVDQEQGDEEPPERMFARGVHPYRQLASRP